VPDRHPTARRLIDHGLRLFAEHGVAATPIVKIEDAAGLAPGSGAFYRHFRSKDELLAAAVEDVAASMQSAVTQLEMLDGYSLEDQVVLLARGTWLVFDAHRDLVLVLTRDAGRKPAGYSHSPTSFPGAGVAFVAGWLRARVDTGDLAIVDPDATALVLLDALTNYWLQREAEDAVPYGVDGDRFVAAWVELVLATRRRRSRRAR
jgi:AcrR family transcriptional regulator